MFFVLHLGTSDSLAASSYGSTLSKAKGPLSQPPGFRPLNESKFAIVTFTTEQKSFTHLSLKNKAYYAKKHGYDFYVDYEQHNERGLMWSKFDMVQRVANMSKYDWVWWMDFDTLITNTNTKLEDVVAESLKGLENANSVDWLFTPDCFELNAGSFLTRATPRINKFVNAVIEYHETHATQEHQLSEQDCMRDIMFKEKRFLDNTHFIPQHKINAFPAEIPCFDQTKIKWEPGTFAIHFAGAWAHVHDMDDPTGYLMKKYEKEIIW
ncbi:hypothetical protein EJ08DRAFT_700824 [Tothia fuscella]|uniref:Glycosyltransferase family 34 protein n=1 Tax=Tothia fuscella TaxID=1048955 RepID=A0A9P4NK82_9PEZI|nr:hypothetical protein EJ08DRAFT_700824 [Tothia fuscella]